ncbi:aminoacyl-tRNA hydrolase [bacterium]|nr:aminoacyl-tRNA hydrolase [Chloroflexi bacterium CFX6]RIL12663.1 MAG: aminoacyl-tRNA hydrolase [bacterium]
MRGWPLAVRRDPARDSEPAGWLVVGLGNPGARYADTRHNVGRRVVERLAHRHGATLTDAKFNARFGRIDLGGQRVCLCAPMTYMNESGRAVVPLAGFFKIPPERVLVVYDDLDLPFGQIRVRADGGAGGHNGMHSLIGAFGTPAFPRVRIGIGRPPPGWDAADFVLARFGSDEAPRVDVTVDEAADIVEAVVRDGVDAAMNTFNRRA